MTRTMDRDRLDSAAEADGLQVCVTPGPCGTVQVAVSGEIDLHNAAALRRALLIALTSYRGPVTVDLRAVTFCDCAGLNALLAARADAGRAHRPLRVTAASGPVDRLLRVSGTRSRLV
ncbi:hypothetical protein KPP03845_107148 [Streptomyces xanthophaeus]|uniref:STAS domain-containing protein n=1 Tax=Streptomyces xanthophaeus TaxID=67385 RepID=UPI00233EEE03|nr:STAS domain-containing protein [Streptomyces xanthophaeus]WCD90720.1 hypothetical protein KPP03845_107148 [Streptomyces xanthophaeus]